MNMDSVNKWLMLAANIGVIAGIIFLGFELQQNNQLLESQTRFNHKETRANVAAEFSHNPGLAIIIVKARDGEVLSPVEQLQLNSYYDRILISWEWEFYEASADRMSMPINGYRADLRRPVFKNRWEQMKISFEPGFVEFIEENIIDQ